MTNIFQAIYPQCLTHNKSYDNQTTTADHDRTVYVQKL